LSTKLLLISGGCALDLLVDCLRDGFEIVATAQTSEEGLQAARNNSADVVCIDADLLDGNASDLISRMTLVQAAPIVAVSAYGSPGGTSVDALLGAGARAVVSKPSGPVPLDLSGDFGMILISTIARAASA